MSSSIFTIEGRTNTKLERVSDYRKKLEISTKGVNKAYYTNGTKEELCLEYISNFISQFQKIYPKRKIPPIVIPNEYGIQKFVCTTVRPQQVPYSELYNMYECASFLASFILYEPLDPIHEVPKCLPSPSIVLNDYTGDCFDLSNLLCSYLLGSGYDAYIVNGYTSQQVALKDQSSNVCPIALKSSNDKSSSTTTTSNNYDSKTTEDDEGDPAEVLYVPPDNRVTNSKYIEDSVERKKLLALDKFVLWKPFDAAGGHKNNTPPTTSSNNSDNSDDGTQVHAWVLVRSGKRDVKEHVFIETTTGRVMPCAKSPYKGIESIWNHKNYWINIKEKADIKDIDFEFENNTQWEGLFMPTQESGNVANLANMMNGETKNVENELEVGNEMGEIEETENTNTEIEVALDPPVSWVTPLKLHSSMYRLRFPPTGKRSVIYSKSKADFFTRNSNPQGMVMRVTAYLDESRIIVREVHEWYENRKDKMYKRVRAYIDEHKVIEYFHPGSIGEVKSWEEWPGKRRNIEFHVQGRLDRLCRREEVIGKIVHEHFVDRSDLLLYRSVTISTRSEDAGPRKFVLPGGSLGCDIYVLRMVTRFGQDTNDDGGNAIAERIFEVNEGKTYCQYHYSGDKITNTVRNYHHSRGPETGEPQPFEIIETDEKAQQEMVTLEREIYSQIRLSMNQMSTIERYRNESETSIYKQQEMLQKTIFEVAADKASMTSIHEVSVDDAVESKNEEREIDYLTPFLRNVKDPQKMSAEEALDVRQSCLDAFRARLVERANIIQARLAYENAKLVRKQEQFQRSQRDGDLSTEEYEKYCTEAMFRINILEQRQVAHEEQALKKFAELDSRLSADNRLKVLLAKE